MGYVCATVKFAAVGNFRIYGIVGLALYVSRGEPEAQARTKEADLAQSREPRKAETTTSSDCERRTSYAVLCGFARDVRFAAEGQDCARS
jgi:hypothetical protein